MAGEQDSGTMSSEMANAQPTDWADNPGLKGSKGNPGTNSGTALGSQGMPPLADDIPDSDIVAGYDPGDTGSQTAEGT